MRWRRRRRRRRRRRKKMLCFDIFIASWMEILSQVQMDQTSVTAVCRCCWYLMYGSDERHTICWRGLPPYGVPNKLRRNACQSTG